MIRSLLATTFVFAAATPAFANDVRSIEIEYDARDLTSPDGIRDLEARIADAAERVCDVASIRLEAQRAERRCEEATRSDAIAELRARTQTPAARPTAVDVSTH